MGRTLATWISENLPEIKKLIRSGVFSATLLRDYEIYVYYGALRNRSKMQNYQDTAEAMRASIRTVMNSIKKMESKL